MNTGRRVADGWPDAVACGTVTPMVDDVVEVSIRPATVEDAPSIAQVHAASWREAYAGVISAEYLAGLDVDAKTEQWRDVLAHLPRPDAALWVAHGAERVVGFAHLAPSRDEDADRSTMEIHAIYLEPRAWGQGVARELLRTVLAAVPAESTVTLWVLAANERARHFYRRNGFVPDGVERLEQIGDETYREVRYLRR